MSFEGKRQDGKKNEKNIKMGFGGRDSRFERAVECLKRYEPEKIIAFGSWVRGEADEYSDFDFVVIKRTSKRFLERLIEVARLIGKDIGKVDVFVYTPEEFRRMIQSQNPFIMQVLEEGVLVYEKK